MTNKLSSLLERDESPPGGGQPNIDALVSSPAAPPNTAVTPARFRSLSSAVNTPQTASRIYPSLGEMHPSKVHHSTTKPSGHRGPLSSHPVNDVLQKSPSKPEAVAIAQNTPTKAKGSVAGKMTSPTFDFSFERPESDLSAEAQKIMDSVREEAAKIKAQMMEERSKQEYKDGEADQLFGVGGRHIAKPKGKSGRYSDVHKQEFKKMGSIANHASAWKNKIQANASSLKRSPSKAGLVETEQSLPRSKSFKSFHTNASERLENTSPGKRAKRDFHDDTSFARPVSRDTDLEPESVRKIATKNLTISGLPSAATTPTKSSLARSASVKNVKTSMIPSLSRSNSTKTLGSLSMPRTEGSNKYLSSLARFGNMKSILHRPQPKFSDDPAKVAAGTHLPRPQGKANLEKDLPNFAGNPAAGFQGSPTIKRVDFSTSTKSCFDLASASPSHSKIPAPQPQPQPSDPVVYPILANSPNITTRRQIPKAPTPGDFTFRADKTINFSPSKTSTLNSPSPTIRHVRPSGISTPLPAFTTMPAIPHEMPNKNKKRQRADSDTETEDTENHPPASMSQDDDEGGQPRAKKQRFNTSPEKHTESSSPFKRRLHGHGVSRIPNIGGGKEKGRGLTLGRLNVLARPKERR